MSLTDPDDSSLSAGAALRELDRALGALREGQLSAIAFCTIARGHAALRQSLPPRYDAVLLDLLDRLESSGLFTEESCSFSQRELRDSLRLWLEKARAQLERAP